MAKNKEAIAIVLDVGPSMNDASPGQKTNLQTAQSLVISILQRKLFAELKDEVALVLFGCDATANDLASGDSYQRVKLAYPLSPVSWELLDYVDHKVEPGEQSADFLDALVVAMDHLMKTTQARKDIATKTILLLSDLDSEFSPDQLDDIVGSLIKYNFQLNLIGPDTHDPDLSNSHDDDMDHGRKGPTNQQKLILALFNYAQTAGVQYQRYTFTEVLPALSHFQTKQVKPAAWKTHLEMGSQLQIPVAGYIRTRENKPKTFKNVYAKEPEAAIQRLRTYHLNNEDETEIDKEEIVDGHRYGSTLVPFSDEDRDAFKYPSTKGLQVLGFTKLENARRGRFLGDGSTAIVAEPGDRSAALALSAFIKAMYETNSGAVVRRVYRANDRIQLGLLVPVIKAKYECLYLNELPFAEDLRQFTFSSLPAEGPSAPTAEQLQAVDQLIMSMDLSTVNNGEEAFKPKLLFNPYIQRLYQCLYSRATDPDAPLPPLNSVIQDSLQPLDVTMASSRDILNQIKALFPLKETDGEAKAVKEFKEGEGQKEDEAGPSRATGGSSEPTAGPSGATAGPSGLIAQAITQVGSVTPVADFEAMLSSGSVFVDVVDQFIQRIEQLVSESFGTQAYSKAIDALKALRKFSVEHGHPQPYNDLLLKFKKHKRQDFWLLAKSECVTLLSSDDVSSSTLTPSQCQQLVEPETESATKQQETEDDLLENF